MISLKNQMSDENAKQDWYLLFSVSSSLYAVGLPYVFRITAIDQIYPVPETKEYVLGVIKAAGAVWSVEDLRIKFGEKEPEILRHPMGVLLEYKENKMCILIDDVRSVFTADPEEMIPPLGKNSYVSGSMQIENRIISFLSIDGLFD